MSIYSVVTILNKAAAIVFQCQNLSHAEIIEHFHGGYFDPKRPYIKHALDALHVPEYEVAQWGNLNL